MGLETGKNDDIQASTVKQSMEQQKENLENTNVRTQQGTSFNKEAVDNSMSNQLNLCQLLQLLGAGTPLIKEYVDFQKSKLDSTIKRGENQPLCNS
jgi:dihydrofolate reductase